MTPWTFVDVALTPGLRLLPGRMDTLAARAMVLAICLQESDLRHRRQVRGPARGYAQFERTGVAGVLVHRASAPHAAAVLEALDYRGASAAEIHAALEHHDVLTVVFARLLLWTLPVQLPHDAHQGQEGWRQYLAAWNPGKPRPAKWPGSYSVAWDVVTP